MVTLKIHTTDQELISKINAGVGGFFYKSNKKDADISFKQNWKNKYFCKRKVKHRDEGFYFSGNNIQTFDIKFGQLYKTATLQYYLKSSSRNKNTKGKTRNL